MQWSSTVWAALRWRSWAQARRQAARRREERRPTQLGPAPRQRARLASPARQCSSRPPWAAIRSLAQARWSTLPPRVARRRRRRRLARQARSRSSRRTGAPCRDPRCRAASSSSHRSSGVLWREADSWRGRRPLCRLNKSCARARPLRPYPLAIHHIDQISWMRMKKLPRCRTAHPHPRSFAERAHWQCLQPETRRATRSPLRQDAAQLRRLSPLLSIFTTLLSYLESLPSCLSGMRGGGRSLCSLADSRGGRRR